MTTLVAYAQEVKLPKQTAEYDDELYSPSLKMAMPTWLFARMCDKTKWPPCYR